MMLSIPELLLLILLRTFCSTQGACDGPPSCFSVNHSSCQSQNAITEYEYVRVNISSPLNESNAPDFLQTITAIVCHHISRSTNENATFCWDQVFDNSTCQQSNCSSVLLSVADGDSALSSATLRDLLLREDTQLALNVAGYSLCSVSIDGMDGSTLTGVPVFSWVSLGVGLLLSGIVLSKPLWWDRLLVRVHSTCTKSDRQQEGND